MQKVYTATELSEAIIVRDMLAGHGIEAFLFNENAAGTMVVGAGLVHAEVWVETKYKAELAKQLIKDLQTDESHESSRPCPSCKEDSPGSFSVCWNCGEEFGAPRD